MNALDFPSSTGSLATSPRISAAALGYLAVHDADMSIGMRRGYTMPTYAGWHDRNPVLTLPQTPATLDDTIGYLGFDGSLLVEWRREVPIPEVMP